MKLSRAHMGFSGIAGEKTGNFVSGLKGYIHSLLGRGKTRVSPLTAERERFEREVKDQFLKLKEKGLSIPVFTL